MLDAIRQEFVQNLKRVQNLIDIYNVVPLVEGKVTAEETQDILRAAVAFLHGTLEELLRELLRQFLPDAPRNIWHNKELNLDEISLPHLSSGKKFYLRDLVGHRGISVDTLIAQAVDSYLQQSNFNSVGEVKKAMRQLGVDPTLVDRFTGDLSALMKRRHQIVHQLDSNRTQHGKGHNSPQSLKRDTVARWSQSVQDFGTSLFEALGEESA